MPDEIDPKPVSPHFLTEAARQHLQDTMPEMFAKGYIVPAPDAEPEPPPSFRPESVEAYTDATLFPLTTRAGMSFGDQAEEDLYWIEEIRVHLEGGGELRPKRRSELLELLCKVPALVALMRPQQPPE